MIVSTIYSIIHSKVTYYALRGILIWRLCKTTVISVSVPTKPNVRGVLRKKTANCFSPDSGRPPKALVKVYGCQQNISDGQRIEGILQSMGFEFCNEVDDADLVLFRHLRSKGTCRGQNIRKRRCAQGLQGAPKEPELSLCAAVWFSSSRLPKNSGKSYPHVDLLFGTHVQHKLPELLYEVLSKRRVFLTFRAAELLPRMFPQEERALKAGCR